MIGSAIFFSLITGERFNEKFIISTSDLQAPLKSLDAHLRRNERGTEKEREGKGKRDRQNPFSENFNLLARGMILPSLFPHVRIDTGINYYRRAFDARSALH